MLWLSLPERTRWSDLCDYFARPDSGCLNIQNRSLCDLLLFAVRIENCRAITGASVIPLAVKSRRIVDLKKEFEEFPIAQLLGIEDEFYSLCVRSMISIRSIRNIATGVPDPCRDNAWIAA
jgi:hypothetical protein